MSMDYWEYQQEAAMDAYYEELYLTEFKDRAIEEFTEERLRSYYIDHPKLIENAFNTLHEAKKIQEVSPTASILLAAISIELCFKIGILKPIIFGFVHSETAAEVISNMTIKQTGIDRFKSLLITLLKDISSVDISKYCRDKATKPLWDERDEIQKLRNRISHQGILCTSKDSAFAICVAEAITTELLPNILGSLGMKISNGEIVE